jgi:hypothetical protein
VVVSVELFGREIEALIRLGFLERSGASDRDRIGRAVVDLVERVLERTRPNHRWW